ncbi:MAG: ABC transporter permease [Rhodobacteraceae bacterium]|jgi:peptide/nickel transport system permease protein|nr:ABC transporter permease [Paracoccaceae bacterium]
MIEEQLLATGPADLPVPAQRPGLLRRALRQTRGRIGLGVLLAVVALSVAGPWIAPHSPYDFVAMPFQPPDAVTWLGADNMGRDVLSRILNGGWILMTMALSATALAMLAGTVLGLVAGYAGGRTDAVIMRLLDVVLAVPERVLVLMFVSVIGANQVILTLATGLVFIPSIARTARAATMDIVRNEYVEYAEAIGMSRWQLLRDEILPNVTTPLMVEAGFRLTWSIGLITGISFIGFGTQPPTPEWGLMINESRDGLLFQPWAVVAPILCIAAFVIGVNLLADAIARAAGRTE